MARSARAALITEPDPYKVLGLTARASQADIEKARRRVAAVHHPDTGPASERAERELAMKRINVAYELLRDPGARAAYDLATAPLASRRVVPPAPVQPVRRGSPVNGSSTGQTRPRPVRRRPRRTHSTAVRPLELFRAIGFLVMPLLQSRIGLYALLFGSVAGTIAVTPFPDQIAAALTTATVAILLPPLLLRRLRGTPAGDLLSYLGEVIGRR